MPTNSVVTLPPAVRAKIDQYLHNHGYADYDGLVKLLESEGYEISRSALGRYGKAVKEKAAKIRESTQLTTELINALGDDVNNLGLASLALAQQSIFGVLADHELDLSGLDDDARVGVLLELYKALPRLSAGFVQQDKRRTEIAKLEKLERDAKSNKRGLDPETIAAIKREVYGL